jgi:aminodeoxyfutalosine synthase
MRSPEEILNFFKGTSLLQIAAKILAGERIGKSEGRQLYRSGKLFHLGLLADWVNQKKNKDYVYFGHNLNVNPTNVCQLRCPLCAYSKDSTDPQAYFLSLAEIKEQIRKGVEKGISEIHLVSGVNDKYDLDFFITLFSWIKETFPHLHIQALTVVEYDYLSKISGLSLVELFERLKVAGLGSIPGGGAEIFAPAVRKKIAPRKISAKRWLEIMETAHQVGIKSNATMLYGHLESWEDRLDHLLALRELQDKTGGFKAFVPLAFKKKNTAFEKYELNQSGFDHLFTVALARVILDNFDHIKILPNYFDFRLAQVMLSFGASDLGSTALEEKIAAAAQTGGIKKLTREDFIRAIKEVGKIPVESNSGYQLRRIWG